MFASQWRLTTTKIQIQHQLIQHWPLSSVSSRGLITLSARADSDGCKGQPWTPLSTSIMNPFNESPQAEATVCANGGDGKALPSRILSIKLFHVLVHVDNDNGQIFKLAASAPRYCERHVSCPNSVASISTSHITPHPGPAGRVEEERSSLVLTAKSLARGPFLLSIQAWPA